MNYPQLPDWPFVTIGTAVPKFHNPHPWIIVTHFVTKILTLVGTMKCSRCIVWSLQQIGDLSQTHLTKHATKCKYWSDTSTTSVQPLCSLLYIIHFLHWALVHSGHNVSYAATSWPHARSLTHSVKILPGNGRLCGKYNTLPSVPSKKVQIQLFIFQGGGEVESPV